MEIVNRDCLAVAEDRSGRISALVVSSDEDRETFRTDVLGYAAFDANPETLFSDDIWVSQMWKSPAGRHFLCDVLGTAIWQDGSAFRRTKLDAAQLYGIWGLSDDAVYTVGNAGRCFFFDGSEWTSMHLDGGPDLSAVHGRSITDMVVAGNDGVIARWDGSEWRTEDLAMNARFRAVHMMSDGTVFAAGLSGTFVRLSDGELTVFDGTSDDLYSIQPFRGSLYVGSAEGGIHVVDGNSLVPAKPKARGYFMHASERHLTTCGVTQMAQFDGTKWRARSFS
jgi:hypothetical protein